jgi:predicted transcriptional regulator
MKTLTPVSSLLHHKGSTVWQVSPEATVFDAIKLMAEKNIGALPVMSRDRLVGIFTERDYRTPACRKFCPAKSSASPRMIPSRNACG